jgi:hypothetical protein
MAGRVTAQSAEVLYSANPKARVTAQSLEVLWSPTAYITSLTPSSGIVGASVTIAGVHFGASQDSGTVTFDGAAVTTYTSWSDTEIVCVVPEGLSRGVTTVTVTNSDGLSDTASFTVTIQPSITSLTPASGLIGTSVTVSGTGFLAAQGTGSVAFGTSEASITSWEDTEVVCVVPEGLTAGSLTVTLTNSDSLSDTEPFEVTAVTRKRRTRLNLILLVGN